MDSRKRIKKMKDKEERAKRMARKQLDYLGRLDIGFTPRIRERIMQSVVQDRRRSIRTENEINENAKTPFGRTLMDFMEKANNIKSQRTTLRCYGCGNILVSNKASRKYNWTPGSVKFGIKKCRVCKKATNDKDRLRREQNQK